MATKKIKKFQMSFKSKFKDPQQMAPFERHAVRGRKISTTIDRRPFDFYIRGRIPKALLGRNDATALRREMKLVKTRTGRLYVIVPVEVKMEPALADGDICALDPGVRTFQTVYGTDGLVAQIGTDFGRMRRTLETADKLIGKRDGGGESWSARARRHVRRRYLRALERVRNRVNDLHHKVASWLCRSYKIILIPVFETQAMVSDLTSKTARAMMTWAHFRFRQTLLAQAQRYTDCKVFVVGEAYTSKTCGACGVLKTDLGGAKCFECDQCAVVMDRDENAARNILLKHLPSIVA